MRWLACIGLGGLLAVGGPASALARGAPPLGALKSAYANDRAHSRALADQIQTLAGQELAVSRRIYLTERRLARLRARQVRAQAAQVRAAAVVVADRAAAARDHRAAQAARHHLRGQLVFWYEQGNVPFVQVLFQAKNFSDLLYRAVAMQALVERQQEVMRQDLAILRIARRMTRRSIREERLAFAAKLRVERLTADVNAEQAAEQQMMAHVAAQKNTTTSLRAGTIQAMQRLASEISAVEQAQARAAAAAAAAARQAAEKAKSATAPAPSATAPPATPSAGQLQVELTDAARLTGVGSSWVPWLELIANYESSGEPSAVSPVAVDGEHATGLMQMLPATFQRYALPGYADIWNATDNAAAAIRYIQANYGEPWKIPGISSQSTYRGY